MGEMNWESVTGFTQLTDQMWNQKNYVYVDSKEIIIKYLRNIFTDSVLS